jgi:hypothetical protein
MTFQFSKQPIAVLSDGLPKMGSGLVCRLVCARDDPGKERIRMWLIDLDDAQLQSGLGLTVEDIAVLRTGTKTALRCIKKNDFGRTRCQMKADFRRARLGERA